MDDGKEVTLLDQVQAYDKSDEYSSLYGSLSTLSNEELELINLRYFSDLTQSEIAGIWGTNQVKVSRNEQKILKKLKNDLCKPL